MRSYSHYLSTPNNSVLEPPLVYRWFYPFCLILFSLTKLIHVRFRQTVTNPAVMHVCFP